MEGSRLVDSRQDSGGIEGVPEHVIAALGRTAEAHGSSPAMRYKADGEWKTITWNEYQELVRQAANGFIELGLERGKGVAILHDPDSRADSLCCHSL
jgi:long-subunit acyl-CoA synthetase (AMP-forming)